MYSTTNPGGVGHLWYKNKFIIPWQGGSEIDTRFIPALVVDNNFNNPDYVKTLEQLPNGWRKQAWRYGRWDIAAGQFFTTFRRDVHVIDFFDDTRAVEWFAALDYGFTHYTVVLLGCRDGDGNIFVVDEHAERGWVPERHAHAILSMFKRHGLSWKRSGTKENTNDQIPICRALVRTAVGYALAPVDHQSSALARFVAGSDVFSRQSDGTTIAQQYSKHGIVLSPANMDRVNGWAEILTRLGDPDAGIRPKLFIHKRCARLIECLPSLQHDPNHPEDVLKVDMEEDGLGGDDTADALRYLIGTKPREIFQRKLTGY
jgi:phage terminase large subunit